MSEDIQKEIDALKQEKENYLFLVKGLTYDHQMNTRITLLVKANNIQARIDELELLNKTNNI